MSRRMSRRTSRSFTRGARKIRILGSRAFEAICAFVVYLAGSVLLRQIDNLLCYHHDVTLSRIPEVAYLYSICHPRQLNVVLRVFHGDRMARP